MKTVREIVGDRGVSTQEAAKNQAKRIAAERLTPRERVSVVQSLGPCRPRAPRRGLLCIDAAGMWQAVLRGELPQPQHGPRRYAWPRAAVTALAARYPHLR